MTVVIMNKNLIRLYSLLTPIFTLHRLGARTQSDESRDRKLFAILSFPLIHIYMYQSRQLDTSPLVPLATSGRISDLRLEPNPSSQASDKFLSRLMVIPPDVILLKVWMDLGPMSLAMPIRALVCQR